MKIRVLSLFLFSLLFIQCQEKSVSITQLEDPRGADNIAYFWGKVALEATAFDTERFAPRPTITSRYLGLIFTSIFDAWSVYDPAARPVYLDNISIENGQLRDKEIAISYAAYYSLKEYYFADSLYFKDKMKSLGLDPDLKTFKKNTAEYIGHMAANAVIRSRRSDGSNQYGSRTDSGQSYQDYTNYKPLNTADLNQDINRWQPKYFTKQTGERFAPSCLTPYWQYVTPISLAQASQFRSPPPPYYGSDQLKKEVAEVVELQANMTDEQKGLVEFMRDGPKSVQQAGHWLLFAQEISKRDSHDLDTDVKMYFLNQITAMDAFIASWDTKMYYDYARPYALVHEYFKGKEIQGWKGYDAGWGTMDGSQWRPYSPDLFLCPPFPSYVSGHSTISGACAEALKLFKGSDDFGFKTSFKAGSLTEPESEWSEIEIFFPTFTEAAEMAGFSRVLGGYHIESDNREGLILGRRVAREAYQFYLNQIGS